MQPYALKAGEGRTYNYGVDTTVKVGELNPGRGAAVIEYTTRKGEEPPRHTHPTEDELFYVLEGEVTFHCGGEDFEVETGGMMVLPQGIQHGYTIRSDGDVRLLVITYPTRETSGQGWGGYVADVESQGTPVNPPES
jgi:quercetin dioxygenase-like cupin family protein